MRKKSDLPQKICAVCGRPFAWRRKWARDWEAVRYCSDRCRSQRNQAAAPKRDQEPEKKDDPPSPSKTRF